MPNNLRQTQREWLQYYRRYTSLPIAMLLGGKRCHNEFLADMGYMAHSSLTLSRVRKTIRKRARVFAHVCLRKLGNKA
jgi:hypothetical protein